MAVLEEREGIVLEEYERWYEAEVGLDGYVGGLRFCRYASVVRNQFLLSFGEVAFSSIRACWERGLPALEAADLIACGF